MKKVLFLLIIPMFSLFSQEGSIEGLSDRKIINLIDELIDDRNLSISKTIEEVYQAGINSQKFEKHILERADELVGQDDLSYPLFLVESILTYNLESKGAQKLYVAIINRKIEIEDRSDLEIEKEELKRAALEELREEVIEEIEEQDVLSEIVEESREYSRRLSEDMTTYKRLRYVNNTYFYPLSNSIYESEVYDDYMNQGDSYHNLDGLGLEMGMGFTFPKAIFRFDYSINLSSRDIFSNRVKHITSFFNSSITYPSVPYPIFLRLGFLYDQYIFDSDVQPNVAITDLPSSTIGIGLNGFQMFNVVKLDTSIDLLIAPLYTSHLDSGILTRLFVVLNVLRVRSYNLEIKGGFENLRLSQEDLTENSFNPKIGIGFSRYE